MFPQILEDIKKYLLNKNFELTSFTNDGRINSALNEDQITYLIKMYFGDKIVLPNARDWYDFAIDDDSGFYPVNIKISTTKTADNLNCKLGIYYALTGQIPSFNNEINWKDYFIKLKNNIQNNDKDYYFLIINKNDYSDIFLCSLKTLYSLTPNGNNLPFQAKWDENRKPEIRTYDEAYKFILGCFAKSLYRRSEVTNYFLKHFPEFQQNEHRNIRSSFYTI